MKVWRLVFKVNRKERWTDEIKVNKSVDICGDALTFHPAQPSGPFFYLSRASLSQSEASYSHKYVCRKCNIFYNNLLIDLLYSKVVVIYIGMLMYWNTMYWKIVAYSRNENPAENHYLNLQLCSTLQSFKVSSAHRLDSFWFTLTALRAAVKEILTTNNHKISR